MITSDLCRALFDLVDGGKPQAFKCIVRTAKGYPLSSGDLVCGKIVRTLAGMRAHLRQVHGWKAQAMLFEKTALETSEAQNG